MLNKTLILAIESSCDETAISILQVSDNSLRNCLPIGTVLSNEVSSQVKLHAKWGGVVPNLAAREHVKNITPVFELALKNAGIDMKDIDIIAVTEGPGLIPALMVGCNFAKTIAYLWEKPLLGIHHIEGHIYANFIGDKNSVISNDQFPMTKQIPKSKCQKNTKCKIQFPALCLVVSGGHTQLILMKSHLQYEIIGQTLDDAVGEAFDKVARILGIGYPGGPSVARWASKFQDTINNNQNLKKIDSGVQTFGRYNVHFPRPMINKPGFNFSFSGLKTAVLYETKKHPELLRDKDYIAAVCHEFQQATIDVLVAKTLKAAGKYKPKTIMLAGGVSANTELRKQLGLAVEKFIPNVLYKIPDTSLTGDNAAMIAAAAAFRWQKMTSEKKKKTLKGWETLQPNANLKIK
jgi:N6-L-threonylcarbamoyladenine synthase